MRTIQEIIWNCRFGYDNDLGRTREGKIYVAGGARVKRELKLNPALVISSPNYKVYNKLRIPTSGWLTTVVDESYIVLDFQV